MRVRNLTISFGAVEAVRGVDLDVSLGETVAIVGESGSGKSVTALAVMGLLPEHATVDGTIELAGINLLEKDEKYHREHVRGQQAGIIFQDPMTALNPVLRVGYQVTEGLVAHGRLERRAARSRACELFEKVRISDAEARTSQFPHQFSGGMRQRAVTAMAIGSEPRLLIADEPTTALDVTTQAQIVRLFRDLQLQTGAGALLISHDLGVVAGVCDRIYVMYAGKIVESGRIEDVFLRPTHPYTLGLLQSIPSVVARVRRLVAMPGHPHSASEAPEGCPFRPRCTRSGGRAECLTEPDLRLSGEAQYSACHFWSEVALPGGEPV